MHHDLALVAACLESGDVRVALQSGARPEILGDEARLYWETLMDHYDQFHEVPSVPYFEGLCPTYQHHSPSDSVQAIVHELKTFKLGSDIDGLLHRIAERNVTDPWTAKKELVEQTDRVNLFNQQGNTDLVLGADSEDILDTVARLQRGEGLIGLPWPWEPFNKRSTGLCSGNVAYIYGRQKSMKTWLVLQMALFYEALGYKVLFCTREMSREELSWRAYALRGHFVYEDLIKGKITSEGKRLLKTVMEQLLDRKRFVVSSVADGIAGFKAKIEETRPHIVFHDYPKAMADDAMGDRYRGDEHKYVSTMIDKVVNYANDKAKVPMILCGHANREGAKTKGRSSTEHAWSDHITRRVHAAIRVVRDRPNHRMALLVNAGRMIPEDVVITLNTRLCTDFGTLVGEGADWIQAMGDKEESEDTARQKVEAEEKQQRQTIPTNFNPKTFRPPFQRR